MTPEIEAAIIAVVAAILGYAFREWRNHARPFLVIIGFEGDTRRSATEVPISEDVVEKLKKAFRIERLTNRETLNKVTSTVESINEIQQNTPIIVRKIDNVLEAIKKSSDEDLSSLLADIFEPNYMDYYLALLLTNHRVNIPTPNLDLVTKISTYDNDDNDGCTTVVFSRRAVNIGFSFNKDKFIKNRFQSLISLIEKLDRSGINTTLISLKSQLENELAIATEIRPKLKQILDEYSLWEVRVYFANLRATPILIEPISQVFVRDKTGAEFQEECSMVMHMKQPDGEISRRLADSPLIIPSGGYEVFSFVTKHTQKEMTRGQAFRDAFSNKQAVAWMKLTIRGIGLIKMSTITTSKEPFRE